MPSSICGTDAMRIPDARISYAAVAVRQHNKSLKAPIARKKLVLRKRESGLKTEVKVARSPLNVAIERIVNHFGVLTTGELVNEIMTHLRQDAPALSRMMSVNNQFAAAATHLLWGSAYPEDLCRARDKGYAKFVTKAHFWTHESLSSSRSAIPPTFSGLETLELHDTSLRSGTAGAIIPYLNAPLRNLTIWTEDESQVTEPKANSRDNVWLKHVAATCSKLESLTFELLLDADPGEMVRLFKSMPQLKSLQLGEKTNRALDDAALLEILTLPHLETLSLQYEISHNIIHVLESRSDKRPILPSIQRLDVCLLDGAGSAPEKLLRGLTTLKSLEINIGNSGHNWQESKDDSVFASICTLEALQSLIVRLEPGLDVTEQDFTALNRLQALRALEISPIPRGFTNANNYLLVPGDIFGNTLFHLKKLDYLSLDLDLDPDFNDATMVLSVEEATQLHHILTNLAYAFIRHSDISVNEEESFGWPTVVNWQDWLELPEDVWLAKNDDSGDTRHWNPRNLRFGVTTPAAGEDTGTDTYDWQDDIRSEIGDEFDEGVEIVHGETMMEHGEVEMKQEEQV